MEHSLLIVDDFFIDRENVKEILASSDLPIVVAGECDDGASALEWVKTNTPSIILSDIEMPIMDGLEFVQNVKRDYPTIDLVIYSVHDKFDYAKRALELGATAYVLKPVEENQLKSVFSKVIRDRESRMRHDAEHEELVSFVDQNRPLLVDRFSTRLFALEQEKNDIAELCRQYGLDLPEFGSYVALAIEADSASDSTAGNNYQEREFLRMRLTQVTEPLLGEFEGRYLFSHVDGTVFGVLLASTKATGVFADHVQETADSIIAAGVASGISLTVGVSAQFSSLAETASHFSEARESLAHKFHIGGGQVIRSDEIQQMSRRAVPIFETGKLHAEVVRLMECGLDDSTIQSFIETWVPVTDSIARSQYKRIIHSIIASVDVALSDQNLSLEEVFESRVIHEEFAGIGSVDQVRAKLADFLREAVESADAGRQEWSSSVVVRTKEFVKQHFAERITVEQVAAGVFYSPNYLNNLFKRETGETILEYITKYRVDRAKELLGNHELKINSISGAVGYLQDSYFRSVFKRAVGVTPSQYRERHRADKG